MGFASVTAMPSVLVVPALRRAALRAALMAAVGCGGNSFLVGGGPEAGTSGNAGTGSTESGAGASETGDSAFASGATSGASSGAGDGGAQLKACNTTSDCPPVATSLPSSVTCEYAIDQGCSAVGTCVTSFDTGPGPVCSTLYYGCGCDGTDVYLGCNTSPALMAQKPISHIGRCASDGGVADASVPPESGRDSCTLEAANYSQACAVDADCMPIFQGDACTQGCTCPSAAISSSSFAQYTADLSNAKKLGASDASNAIVTCECPAYLGPCCRNSLCQVGSVCDK
jgi:hypothetical protein